MNPGLPCIDLTGSSPSRVHATVGRCLAKIFFKAPISLRDDFGGSDPHLFLAFQGRSERGTPSSLVASCGIPDHLSLQAHMTTDLKVCSSSDPAISMFFLKCRWAVSGFHTAWASKGPGTIPIALCQGFGPKRLRRQPSPTWHHSSLYWHTFLHRRSCSLHSILPWQLLNDTTLRGASR